MQFSAAKRYQEKIKSAEEVKEAIGPRPREIVVGMCHGTFDIVHPGHLRHLMYVKERCEKLIVSITCDDHITKANYRPFVPEQLRALNLAAMELVDYVIVDRNPTPLENIRFLEPELFAKGLEYSAEGLHPKTKEEIEVLESYGGEMLFTPGDIVYSSSKIIESTPPRLALEKLLTVMEAEDLSFDDLRKTLEGFRDEKVHVIGDTIVDSYTYCDVIGHSNKTPTLSVRFQERDDFTGGAAVVAKHMVHTGAKVWFSTVLGEDSLKDFVLKDLEESGIETIAVVDRTRPTTQKNAIIANEHRLLKLDHVDNGIVSGKAFQLLRDSLKNSEANSFIFSDFRHGIFNRTTIPEYISALPKDCFKVADSQVASRWGNILEFQGFDLITPNEREARFSLGDQDSVVRPLASRLYKEANCKVLILKLGERGILACRSKGDYPGAFFNLESFADRVVDSVGTGDALLAYATLSLRTTGCSVRACILGSLAAAIACEQEGNKPVSVDAICSRIDRLEKLAN